MKTQAAPVPLLAPGPPKITHEELARFTLWVVSVTGSTSRQIGEVQADDDAEWMPSGEDVVYSHGHDVFLVKADGGSTRKLFTAPGQVSDIAFSPDGKALRFTLRELDKRTESVWEASPEGANPHPLLQNWGEHISQCCGRWTHDGRYYVFQSNDLWILPGKASFLGSRSTEPVRLTSGPLEFSRPMPSNEAGTIFAVGALRRSEIMRYDMHSKDFVPYLFGVSAEFVSFSKDSDWFAYTSYPDNSLWRSRMDGTQSLQLTFPPMRAFLARWSPDGKHIAFMGSMAGKPWNVYIISADGGTPDQVLPEEHGQADPNWTPDGNSIMFGSRDIDCAPIRTIDLSSKRISTLPGSEKFFSPRLSPAGRYVTASTCERPYRLMLFDSQTSRWAKVSSDEVSYPEWSHDGKYVYFRDPHSINRLRVSDRKVERLVDLENMKRLPVGMFGSGLALVRTTPRCLLATPARRRSTQLNGSRTEKPKGRDLSRPFRPL